MQSEASRAGLVVLILITLAVRVGVLSSDWLGFGTDVDAYGRLAERWAETGVYTFAEPDVVELRVGDDLGQAPLKPTAYRPPMYPWMLSSAVINGKLNLLIVAAMHVWLGLATVILVYAIGARLRMRFPSLPALAVACDPLLLRGSQLLMTETLITFLAVSVWLLNLMLIRPRLREVAQRSCGLLLSTRLAALLGAMLGMAVLTRPTMLPWALLTMGLLTVRSMESGKRVVILTTAIIFFLAVVGPWIARNERAFGKPIATTTHGGYTLLLANNPQIYTHFRQHGPDRAWDAEEFHYRWSLRRNGDPTQLSFWKDPLPQPAKSQAIGSIEGRVPEPDIDELVDDEMANQAAMATIKRDPEMFALSCLYRVGWFWAVYPNIANQDQRWSIGIWYAAWFVMAALGLIWMGGACRSRVWLVPLLLVLTLTAIHAVYWSNMRMRAPLMPVVYIVACWPFMRVRTPPTTAGL